jgi:nucleoside-diphosphate-sugar epimerase
VRFLITGYQGFVGRYLAYELKKSYPDATVYGIGRSAVLHDRFTHNIRYGKVVMGAPLTEPLARFFSDREEWYRQTDILDNESIHRVLQELKPEIVIHLAAGLRDDPAEYLFRTNVAGTVSLLEAINESGIKPEKLIVGSTGAVYGMAALRGLPLREETECLPADLYSVSKLAAEHASRILAQVHGLPVLWARLFNLIGPGQDERHVCGKLASQISAIKRKSQDPRIEVGDLAPTRDYVDVRDAASAIALLVKHGNAGEYYNIASGVETSVRSILNQFIELAQVLEPLEVSQMYFRPNDLPRYCGDVERLRSLGFRPRYSFKQSAEDLLYYYLETVPKACGLPP